jgi:hypothetical protein
MEVALAAAGGRIEQLRGVVRRCRPLPATANNDGPPCADFHAPSSRQTISHAAMRAGRLAQSRSRTCHSLQRLLKTDS